MNKKKYDANSTKKNKQFKRSMMDLALILQSLKTINSGEFENALKMAVQCIQNPPNYFAKVIIFF